MDAARYLGVYDIDLIYSWTPRQFKNFMKGAQLREVDELERQSYSAMFNARAANSSKKIGAKDLFDPKKAEREVLGLKPEKKHMGRYQAAKAAMDKMRNSNTKGG